MHFHLPASNADAAAVVPYTVAHNHLSAFAAPTVHTHLVIF